jgi:DNA-binding response OmpR family regulator
MANVIVVEDDPAYRDLVAAMLEGEGHRVSQAASGQAGLDLVDSEPAELVVADLFMSGFNGMSLLAFLRSRRPDLPVVMITGGMGGMVRPYVNAMLALGAEEVLCKPFARAQLLSAVSRALARGKPAAPGVI